MPVMGHPVRAGSKWVKPALIFAGFLAVMYLLGHRLSAVDFAHVWELFHTVPPLNWAMAAITTLISFAALGRYDVLVHRMMDTKLAAKSAMTSGMCGIALGQVLGFGMITGAILRWRMLPGLSLAKVTSVSVLAGLSFLVSWAVLTSLALLVSPFPALEGYRFWPFVGLATLTIAIFAVSLRIPHKFAFFWPSKTAMGAFLFWAFVDTAAASLTLYLLLPATVEIAWPMIFAAYLIALGAGLIANTPGGVGAFELCLLVFLPQMGAEPLLAAVVAFRLVYYAIPAAIALVFLARPARPLFVSDTGVTQADPHLATTLSAQNHQAEAGLIHHRQTQFITPTHRPLHAYWLSIPLAHHFVAIGNSLHDHDQSAIDLVKKHAAGRLKTPCFYKAPARVAARLRSQGFVCIKLSEEAILNPQKFQIEGSKFRQLRRLMRKADIIKIQDVAPYHPLPIKQMRKVADAWNRKKKEHGLSMGRFCPIYLAAQQLILAYNKDQLIGFISFHTSQREWTLDLVRLHPDAPSGTSQKLVLRAIELANAQGINRLSLACAPLAEGSHPGLMETLSHHMSNQGLRRFKQSFQPVWEPRYIATPNHLDLAFAGFNLWLAITYPQPLASRKTQINTSNIHNDDENYEFALNDVR